MILNRNLDSLIRPNELAIRNDPNDRHDEPNFWHWQWRWRNSRPFIWLTVLSEYKRVRSVRSIRGPHKRDLEFYFLHVLSLYLCSVYLYYLCVPVPVLVVLSEDL